MKCPNSTLNLLQFKIICYFSFVCCPIHCLFVYLCYSWQRRCQRIVVEDKLACEWLSERRRHSERPGPARTGLVRIRSGFLSGFRSDSQQESAGFWSECEQNRPRLTHSNQSKDRLLAAGWYVPCPVGCCGLLFWFLVCYAATQLATQLRQRCIQVVRSSKEARKRCMWPACAPR